MIDWTKPVIRLSSGAPARVLCTDGPEPCPIAVWVNGMASPISLTRDGRSSLGYAFANAPEENARLKAAWDASHNQAMKNGAACNEWRDRAERAEAADILYPPQEETK